MNQLAAKESLPCGSCEGRETTFSPLVSFGFGLKRERASYGADQGIGTIGVLGRCARLVLRKKPQCLLG